MTGYIVVIGWPYDTAEPLEVPSKVHLNKDEAEKIAETESNKRHSFGMVWEVDLTELFEMGRLQSA